MQQKNISSETRLLALLGYPARHSLSPIIQNSFIVQLEPERALDVLTDVPQIAECIPGVTLTETLGEGAYAGTAAVRLGPVALSFGGKARIVEIDREAAGLLGMDWRTIPHLTEEY